MYIMNFFHFIIYFQILTHYNFFFTLQLIITIILIYLYNSCYPSQDRGRYQYINTLDPSVS